jgi:hypothetical protein
MELCLKLVARSEGDLDQLSILEAGFSVHDYGHTHRLVPMIARVRHLLSAAICFNRCTFLRETVRNLVNCPR